MLFEEVIKNHLDKMAEQDPAFAERYELKSKSLEKCYQYIISQARKQAKNNCAAIEDAVVFGWAAHYYQEDDSKLEPVKKVKANVSTSTPKVEKPKEIKPIKALVKDKKTNECKQMDLFADFFA